jgi:hypothetical protein
VALRDYLWWLSVGLLLVSIVMIMLGRLDGAIYLVLVAIWASVWAKGEL